MLYTNERGYRAWVELKSVLDSRGFRNRWVYAPLLYEGVFAPTTLNEAEAWGMGIKCSDKASKYS